MKNFQTYYNTQKYQEIITKQENLLAPWAVKDEESKMRDYPIPPDGNRNQFQQDRDRILYASSFRRLSEKTQVFIYNRNSMHRTRLTHSLEVSQISRSIAQMLEVNSDLCEAIALAHDLGHAPFGHAGEMILHEIMKDEGGFEHNRQSLRIVELIESHFINHRGLNLTFATREGIIKHVTKYDTPQLDARFQKRNTTIEAEIVSVADRISYNTHDLEDSFREGLLNYYELEETVPLLQYFGKEIRKKYGKLSLRDHFYRIKGKLIGTLILDVIETSRKNLEKYNIKNFADVIDLNRKNKIVTLSSKIEQELEKIEKYLYKNIYFSPLVVKMNDKAQYLLEKVFSRYLKKPQMLKNEFLRVYTEEEKKDIKRIICDYIAGMTDRYLIEEYRILFDPMMRVYT
jgi:dGTPase